RSQTPTFLQSSANPFPCHTSKKSPVTPIIATLPKTPSRKSFVCHKCETPPGVVRIAPCEKCRCMGIFFPLWNSPLATRHSPLFLDRSFRVHRGAKHAHFVRRRHHFKPAALQRTHFHHFVDQPVEQSRIKVFRVRPSDEKHP